VPNRQILVVPDDYPNLAAAYAVAQPGDMVHVEPATLNEIGTIAVIPSGVRLQGSGPELTTIFATGGYRYFSENSMMDGCRTSSPRIDGVRAIFSNNIVVGARMQVTAGARAIIRNNLFVNASGDGLVLSTNSAGCIENNTFAYINLTNKAALRLQDVSPAAPLTMIQNNIFAFNYVGILDVNFDRQHKLFHTQYNAYWQNSGGNAGGYVTGNALFGPGCFDANPLFTAPGTEDYSLQTGSPCINSGNAEARFNDRDASRNDRGHTGGPCANTHPSADFSITPELGSVGASITLDASLSGDSECPLEEMYFRWDFENDGDFDTSYANSPTTVTSFAASGGYTVRLEVMDRGGFVDFATKTVEIVNQPPYAPSNPDPADGASAVPIDTAAFDWDGGDPDPGQDVVYDVYVGGTPSPPLYAADVSESSVALAAPLEYSRFCFVEVVAKDAEGATASSSWYFVTEPEPTPDGPTALGATAAVPREVHLSWTDASNNEVGFKVERRVASGAVFYQIGLTTDAEITDTTGAVDETYVYRVRAYNGSGNSAYSNESTATVFDVLSITAHPEDQKRYLGEPAEFTVATYAGLGTKSFQWWFDDGAKVPQPVGGNTDALWLGPVDAADEGDYWCDVTDAMDTYASNTATLEVAPHLEIVEHPAGGDKTAGEPHTFAVTAGGGFEPLWYEWKKDGAAVPDATTSSLVLVSLDVEDSGGYHVVVGDANTSVVSSNTAVLTVSTGVPVAGAVGLALLAGGLLVGVLFSVRLRKQQNL